MSYIPNQGQDGVAHVTYYDKKNSLSFVWDGSDGDMIAISWGGYAEPVTAKVKMPNYVRAMPQEFLENFARFCKAYVKKNYPSDEVDS